jgi:hypothetical protein
MYSRAARGLALALVALTLLLGAACCANGDNRLAQSYGEAYGPGGARQSSGLLSGTTSLLTSTVDSMLSTTTDALSGTTDTLTGTVDSTLGTVTEVLAPAATVAVKLTSQGRQLTLQIESTGELKDAFVASADGRKFGESLSGLRGKVSWPAGTPVSYVRVTLKDGGKWYFDGLGAALPLGYTPRVSISYRNNSVYVDYSSDLYDTFWVHYTDGTKESWSTSAYSGWYKPFRGKTVAAVAIRLKSDGSKWYFDNLGAMLPCDSKWYTDVD